MEPADAQSGSSRRLRYGRINEFDKNIYYPNHFLEKGKG
jgi:hypothetical protein